MLPRIETVNAMRRLHEVEVQFLERFFGGSLETGGIRIGSTLGRRSWSPFGARISLSKRHFRERDARSEVDLEDPRSASVFAHEAMHVWQRQHGRAVTREAIPLQAGYLLGRLDPYAYEASNDPEVMLALFESCNVEQQAKIFEDYVFGVLRGRRMVALEAVARCVKSG
jgi:hypothetical protein